MTEEIRALTAARAVAAWMVVLYHIRFAVPGLPPAVEGVLARGYLAVDFFFLLSGFVLALGWHARLREGGWGAARAFLLRRLARIWPLHMAILAACMALAALLVLTGRPLPAQYDPASLPLHILLVQAWGWSDPLVWNDPAWSISAEWAAYLLYPLLVVAIDWQRVPTAAILAAVAAAFILLAAAYAAVGAARMSDDLARLALLRCGVEFACGTALAAVWPRIRHAGAAIPVAGVAAAILFLLPLPEVLHVPAGLAALLLTLACVRVSLPRLEAFGRASFATYLCHMPLWFAFKLAFVDDTNDVPPPLIALYLALVLLASFALYRLVELPAQRALLSRAPRRVTA